MATESHRLTLNCPPIALYGWIVPAAIAGTLDITANTAKATLQPKADAAAMVVAPSMVLCRVTVSWQFMLSSRLRESA
jgi:hypothetical protein